MAIIVEDAFTVGSVNVNLVDHIPNIGTGWTEEVSCVGSVGQVLAFTNVLRASANVGNEDLGYSAQPNPTMADVDVEIKMKNLLSNTSAYSFGIFARWINSNNYYGVQLLPNNHAIDSLRLFKRVGGAFTQLGTIDLTIAVNDVLKLEMRGSVLKVYVNGVEKLSTSDSALNAAGKAGVMWGKLTINGSHVANVWQVDDFRVTEYEAESSQGLMAWF